MALVVIDLPRVLRSMTERETHGIRGNGAVYLLRPFDKDEIARVFYEILPSENFQMLYSFEAVGVDMDEALESAGWRTVQIVDLHDDEGRACHVFSDAERLRDPFHERRLPRTQIA